MQQPVYFALYPELNFPSLSYSFDAILFALCDLAHLGPFGFISFTSSLIWHFKKSETDGNLRLKICDWKNLSLENLRPASLSIGIQS